ncbi:MAG: GNAT family N-acetyltransferase [Coriobacteriia bacterium]|nr:GNAT family N-acetyltransferase [Coriobacteriia bacterium]
MNAGLPVLHGTRVTLRPLTRDDTPTLRALLADPSVVPWWGVYDAPKIERDFFDPAWAYTYLIEIADDVAGLIQFHEVPDPDYKHAGVDVTLAGGHQERGLGTEALRVLIRYLIDVRRHHRITIDPAVDNARAIHVYEKVGFRPVGVMRRYERGADGTWHDNLLMELLAEEFAARSA